MTGWPLHTYRKPIASNAICMTCNLCFLEPERTVHKFILIRDLAFLLNLTGLFVRELALRVSPFLVPCNRSGPEATGHRQQGGQ